MKRLWITLTVAVSLTVVPTLPAQTTRVKTQAEQIKEALPVLREIDRRLQLSRVQLSDKLLGIKAQIARFKTHLKLLDEDLEKAIGDHRRAEIEHKQLQKQVDLLLTQPLSMADKEKQKETLIRSQARVLFRDGQVKRLQDHKSKMQLRIAGLEARYVQELTLALVPEVGDQPERDLSYWDRILGMGPGDGNNGRRDDGPDKR